MIRIAVCDAAAVSLENTVSMIEKWSKQMGIQMKLFAFDNGDALISRNESLHMDIIFLDIIMPLLNGMDVAKEIRQQDAVVNIIFLTSTPEFALESYDVKARGYLVKPVSYDRLKELLDDCSNSFGIEEENLVLKTESGYQKIYYRDIEYIEAQNKKIIVYLCNGKSVRATQTLRSFESNLNDGKLELVDAMPQTQESGHGFGTQSIRYMTEKLKGNCQFVADEQYFILRIVL